MRPTTHAIVLFILLFTFASSAFGAEPVSTRVCEINADPGRFEGVEVLVHGFIYVGMDVTNISDPGCPGFAIQLSVSNEAYRRRDIHAFEHDVRKYGMRATATVKGKFHAKAPVLPYPMPAIDMHAIKNVVFEAK
jgi:hypothetical protein